MVWGVPVHLRTISISLSFPVGPGLPSGSPLDLVGVLGPSFGRSFFAGFLGKYFLFKMFFCWS